MPTKSRQFLRPVTVILAALFLISAALNLGARIPLGFLVLSFASPSSSIAVFEIVIGTFLVLAAALLNLYVYGGAYLFAVVGIAEGLLSPDVQGLARSIHEMMVPFAIAGWALLLITANSSYRDRASQSSAQKTREFVTVLQFFVGGLVTLGGSAFARDGTYPVGTALGLVHLAVGLTGLFAGYAFFTRKAWSRGFIVGIDIVTIVYSAFAEILAEIYAFLPPGINDALIGTIIAIGVSTMIVYILLSSKQETLLLRKESRIQP